MNIVKCQDSTSTKSYNINSKCWVNYLKIEPLTPVFNPIKCNSQGQLLNKN